MYQSEVIREKLVEAMDNLVDLLAANPTEAKIINPRAWKKLLIYAPREANDAL
jgi:hypothetical protein